MTVAVGVLLNEVGGCCCRFTKVVYPIKENESKLPFYLFGDGLCALQFAIASDDVNFPKSAISRCLELH